ncbi:MAG: type II secretion system protein [Rickettsiales bacterium]
MKHGFTLLELSISLIIIALLMGAVASSAAMIRAARYRTIVDELQSLQVAYKTFEDRYHNIPGDFNAATALWPAANCASLTSSCNGNGDGIIETANDSTDEAKAALKHLSLAGLITNPIELINTAPNAGMVLGVSAVQSKTGIVGMYMAGGTYIDKNAAGVTTRIANPFGTDNAVFAGLPFNSVDNLIVAAFPPATAFAMDEKIDDGTSYGQYSTGAGTGKFRVIEGEGVLAGQCLQTISPGVMAYQMSVTDNTCIVGYKLD